MVYEQSRIFMIFFILGILIAFIFDFFRAIRKSIKTPNFITYIEDIIFIIIVGIIITRSIFVFSYGEIRFYIFIAIFMGIVFFTLTIGNLCVIMFKVILDILKKFILCFIRLIKIPIIILKKFLLKIIYTIKYSKNKS